MGRTISRIYADYPHFLRKPQHLKKAIARAHMVTHPSQRHKAASEGVVVTTSGMLDGGPVLQYLSELGGDPNNAVFLTGYQVEGTNGRRLLNEKVVDIDGVDVPIQAEVRFFDFSAHAGHQDLVDFVKGCDPEHVVLCHGEHRERLAVDLESKYQVHMPQVGDVVDI